MRTFLQILILIAILPLVAQTKGSFKDGRDGKVYETITYKVDKSEALVDHDEYGTYTSGSRLEYRIELDKIPSSMTWMTTNLNYESGNSKCKNSTDINCEQFGRLYTWDSAMEACPNGWHLPSDNEWFVLASLYGGVSEAGQHLKSAGLNGTNESEFNVIKPSIFWSSNELDESSALDWKVNYRWTKLQRWKGGKNLYNSVRCVKDY